MVRRIKATRRRLNFKLIACLVIPAVVLSGAGYAIYRVQMRRNARALLEQAQRAHSAGDIRKAEESLRLFLAYQPNHPKALASYGLILASRANFRDDLLKAFRLLERALRADPDRRDLLRRTAEVAMSLGNYAAAQNYFTTLLGRKEPGAADQGARPAPAQGEIEYLIAFCAEGSGDYPSAARWYKAAIAHFPEHIEAYVRLAWLLRSRLDDPNGADRVMDAERIADGLIFANPSSSRAYLERACYRRRYRITGVEQDLAQSLKLNSKSSEALLASALWSIEKGDLGTARQHLTRGLEHNPEIWRIADALAWVERNSGHLDGAESCLRRGINAAVDPHGRNELLWSLADVQIDRGNLNEASQAMEDLQSRNVPPEAVQFLQARIRIGQHKWIDAATDLENIYPRLLREPALAYRATILTAECYEQLGAADSRLAAYRRAIALDPRALPARLGLAQTLEAMGRLEDAVTAYRELSTDLPGALTDVARVLVQINLQQRQSRRDWKEVDRALDRALRASPNAPEPTILRAEVQLAQGHADRARELLRNARDRQPDRIEFWIALAEFAAKRETPEASLSVIDEAERRFGKRVELRLARIVPVIRRDGAKAGRGLADLEDGLDKRPHSDQERMLAALADAHLKIGDRDRSDQLLGQLVQLRPWDLGARFGQFELARERGDEPRMESLVREMKGVEEGLQVSEMKGGSTWRCAMARLETWRAARLASGSARKQRLAEAKLLLAESQRLRPSWPIVHESQAETDELLGDPGRAVKGYLRAIEAGSQAPAVIRRVVRLLGDLARWREADEAIRDWRERGLGANDRELQRLEAAVALGISDRQRAFSIVRQLTSDDSKDYRDHLWAGRMLWAGDEPVKAEAELRKAAELGKGAAEPWVALVEFLARTGQQSKASSVVEQAAGLMSATDAPLALGRCYTVIGDLKRARDQYRAALAARPTDAGLLRAAAELAIRTGPIREAETELLTIINLKPGVPEQAAWARRSLALMLASTRSPHQSVKALKLLGLDDAGASYRPAPDEPIEEMRAKAAVLALHQNRVAKRAAIRILKDITDRETASASDLDLLAQLEEEDGDWPGAEREISKLLTLDAENPVYLVHVVRAFLRHGLCDDAEPLVAKLEKRQPAALEIVDLRARLLKAKGNANEAVALLNKLIKEQPSQARNAAMLLEEFGEVAAAEEAYRLDAGPAREPEAPLVLAGFLARHNHLAEALDLCEKVAHACASRVVAEAIVTMLSSASIDEAQSRRAEQLLEKELKKSPTDPALLFHLANVKSMQGDYDHAERLYEQSMEYDPANSGPPANLAWLVARRDRNGTKALELVSRAINIDGETPSLLDIQALAFMAMQRPDPAIKNLENAVALDQSPLKLAHLSEAYLMAERKGDAVTALKRAKAAGLGLAKLNPLERKSCEQVQSELTQE
jgi:tetratricopeptide (TPR) repeat protein